jgi:D-alanine transaminase
MSRIAYVDGRFVPFAEAAVPIEDRGLQFADAVYEVWAVHDGVVLDAVGHRERLARSLKALRIEEPLAPGALAAILKALIVKNKVRHGLVYLQVSRGVARRDHPFPAVAPTPTVIMTARASDPAKAAAKAARGIKVMLVPDIRWGRVDIKTTNLLPNVLAKQAAIEAGHDDAWLVDAHGLITEGTAQNAWIVDADGAVRTRPLGEDILAGITRARVKAVAQALGVEVVERAFTPEEAFAAREAFVTSASAFVTPVVAIDGRAIGSGVPGPVAPRLRHAYLQAARAQ